MYSQYRISVTLDRDFDFHSNGEVVGAYSIDPSAPSSIFIYDGAYIWRDFSNGETYNLGYWDASNEFYVVTTYLGGYNFDFTEFLASIDVMGGDFGDIIYGGSAADELFGGGGIDRLYGDGGSDRLDGGVGADRMWGGAGDDTYVVNEVGDRVTELANSGTDTVEAAIHYTLSDTLESLTLIGSGDLRGTGNALDNILTGNDGANVLLGGDGNDTLIGGLGVDRLTGGGGADTFVFRSVDDSRNAAYDLIIDFSRAQSDRIDLSGIDTDLDTASDQAFSFEGGAFNVTGPDAQVIVTKTGSHALVQADLNGDQAADFSILVRGVITLGASDFVL